MKNRYIFCLLLLTATGLQSMESEVKALPDWRTAENKLANHFQNLLAKALDNYDGKSDIDLSDFIKEGREYALPKSTTIEILKKIRLKNGNTFTHLLVMHNQNRGLVQSAEENAISSEKNDDGLTAFDIAYTQFLNLVENDSDLSTLCDERCLYLVLSNYLKIKENAEYAKEMEAHSLSLNKINKLIWCCYRHSH